MRLILLFFILFSSPCFGAPSLKERIKSIPLGDRQTIERLLHHLICDEQFAYTLFGSKPMARASTHRSYQIYGFIYPCPQCLLQSDWKIWERYQDLFPSQSFALFSEYNEGWLSIFLVNKDMIRKTIAKNLSIFQEKLASKDNMEILLENLLTSRNMWKEGLNESHALIGILFGYGSLNATKFEDYHTTSLKFFLQGSSFVPPEPILYALPLPTFASFSDSETAQLQQNYAQERAFILDHYAKGDFLEITLEQLSH